MKIHLKNIVPAPLAGTFSLHEVWNQDLVLESAAYVLKAPSGKGKSTLLHLLNGTRRDYSGQLLFDGKAAATFSDTDWAEHRSKKVSMVFQDLRLFPQLSARENLQLKAKLGNVLSDETLQDYIQRMGMETLMDKPCFQLSFGQQQRVAILRALIQEFQWLLMDEPFSHLDNENISIICQIIEEEVNKRNAGLILSSLGHDYPYPFTKSLSI